MIYLINITLPDFPGRRIRITTAQQAVAMNVYIFATTNLGAAGYVTDCSKEDVKNLKEGLGARDTTENIAVEYVCDSFREYVTETGMDPHVNPVTGTREELPESYGDDTREYLERAFGTELRA